MQSTLSSQSCSGQPVLAIAGPTASGKSALALRAAERLNGVVINADSMQVYRRLRILTARPTEAEEARAPHRLYGWLEPDEICSAGRWRTAALAAIAAAHAAGQLPIVVGGTGFYLETLQLGLPDAPDIPSDIREAARGEVARDPAAVHRQIAAADPETAARIDPGDRQRLARALEIWRATGAPPSVVLARTGTPPPGLRFHTVALMPERRALYARIDARTAAMADAGAVAEAAAFMTLGIDLAAPAAKAVGLREFAAAASDETLLPNAIAAAAQATRRYAKRQMTWMRGRQNPDILLTEQLNSTSIDEKVRILRDRILTTP